MSMFAAHFREHVVPTLKQTAQVAAYNVMHGLFEWDHALQAVFSKARTRGAYSLPEDAFRALEDWIDYTILATITDIERDPGVGQRIMDEFLGW